MRRRDPVPIAQGCLWALGTWALIFAAVGLAWWGFGCGAPHWSDDDPWSNAKRDLVYGVPDDDEN